MYRDRSVGSFVVFEPSYALGCLALLSSLARHASAPVAVDILMREQYRRAAADILDRLSSEYGNKLELRPVIVPQAIVEKCSMHKFKAHFIPEVLFRLYYFDLVTDHRDYVIHLDLDMLIRGDILSIRKEFAPPALLHAVEADMQPASRRVMPAHITRYLNAGLMAFDATDIKLLRHTLHKAQSIVEEIAATALYLDQDAVNIAFYDNMAYLPCKWNYTLFHFQGFPIPADIIVLHATGSRKPWFFRGGHPFSAWYEKEADILGLSFTQRYDFTWAPRRLLKKTKALWAG
jgi:lipopolysaccharide biosynthesis glycosyltransferase